MLAEWMNILWRRSKVLLRRRQLDRDLNDELQFHFAMREQKLQEEGSTAEEAHYSARRQFGNATEVKEANREMWGFALLETVWQDLCYGLRQSRRSPGFTAAAIITLALGIGATMGIFAVFNAVLLQPLPYPDSDRIVQISTQRCEGCGSSVSVPMFVYWQENNPGFEDLAAYQIGASVNLSGGDNPELVDAIEASKNYFRLFGANPILGRTFTAAEDRPGGPRVLVMSYGLWQRRFGGDPSILGSTITLEGLPYSVIGILSPAFQSYPRADVWVPLQADPNSTNQAHSLIVDGRLPSGVTLARANSWMEAIGKRYVQSHPQQLGGDGKLKVTTLQQQITGKRPPGFTDPDGRRLAGIANRLRQRSESTAGASRKAAKRNCASNRCWREPDTHCSSTAHRESLACPRWRGIRFGAGRVGSTGSVDARPGLLSAWAASRSRLNARSLDNRVRGCSRCSHCSSVWPFPGPPAFTNGLGLSAQGFGRSGGRQLET
ncbi:MAG TPA: ABC transporter permease [Bryobacteraceae bacterium]